jgi:hypothetical protein
VVEEGEMSLDRQIRMQRRTRRALDKCKCSDPGCPVHPNPGPCKNLARRTVKRIDMQDETGTRMCRRCAEDALESGVFR